MEVEFIVSHVIPTIDGKEEVHLVPKHGDTMGLTTMWKLTPNSLTVGEAVTVSR